MADPFLIIDGYNLMHAIGLARRRYGPGDLEKCRKQLLGYLSRHLDERERPRTTIVFDAFNSPSDDSRSFVLEDMVVVFAQRGGDADTLIEEMISSHSAPRQILLISSDHRLQKKARTRRAKSVDSEVFAAELERHGENRDSSKTPRQRSDQEHPKFSGKTSRKETAEWLEVFGEVPEAAGLQEDDLHHWDFSVEELENEDLGRDLS